MKTLRKIDGRALWRAFEKFLVVIGACALAVWFAGHLRALEFSVSLAWLALILAVLYGMEVARPQQRAAEPQKKERALADVESALVNLGYSARDAQRAAEDAAATGAVQFDTQLRVALARLQPVRQS